MNTNQTMSSNLSKSARKPDSPVISGSLGPESPTTVRPFELDDDDVPDSGLTSVDVSSLDNPIIAEDNVPVKPPPVKQPKSLSQQEQAENTLQEAFPTIDAAIVKAVLRASSGQIEPAFNALLGMSDPDAIQEPTSLTQPSNHTASNGIGSTTLSQLEADEKYARQLARDYGNRSENGIGMTGTLNSGYRGNPDPVTRQQSNSQEERSFLEDDLPIIKDNLKRGFLETQNKVNGWINILKKKIDGEDDEVNTLHPNGYSSRTYRNNDEGIRKSDEYSPYDADPQVLGDDFAGIQLNSDGSYSNVVENPQIKPTSTPSKVTREYQAKRDSSEQGMVNDIYSASPGSDVEKSLRKQSKWQPLSKLEPNPSHEIENDPFSLGDTDDEKEAKDSALGMERKKTIVVEASSNTPTITTNSTVIKDLKSIEAAAIK